MGWIPRRNGILSVFLSAMMALPIPLWAKDAPGAGASSLSASDEVPVFTQTVMMGGQTLTLVAVPVPESEEARVVEAVASKHPERLALLVEGADDPALKAAKASGRLSQVTTFIASKFENSALFKAAGLAASVKQRIQEKTREITEFCKREKAGLLWAAYYSSVLGGFTAYSSSSVEAGLSVLAGMFLWNSFLITQPNVWDKMLNAGGDAFQNIARKAFSLLGHELSSTEKRVYDATGKFSVGWAASTVTSGGVLMAAGLFTGPLQALWYGLLANYNVWDPVVLKKFKRQKISENFVKRYFAFQFFLGSVFEAAAYLQVPFTQEALVAIVATGLLYLVTGDHVEHSFISRARMLKKLARQKAAEPPSCEELLGPVVARYAQ